MFFVFPSYLFFHSSPNDITKLEIRDKLFSFFDYFNYNSFFYFTQLLRVNCLIVSESIEHVIYVEDLYSKEQDSILIRLIMN